MSNVVWFPEKGSDEHAREPEAQEQGEPEPTDDGAELFILNLYRSKANHPAGSKLPRRRAE